ncbi:oligosaccharide repeat unit polymerase family protein [Methanothermobacter wolfeii]|uniref:oligosaccharide repeat unit polymerase family protein n=1 Tax=Methanothermobacter wolfeii TaxID=145261 RepID=UPI0024B341E6|nr:oligosaccharide repeat unit polymerase family protein [Methanothermobacter wolfeii]MDI6701762.1 oligosaccharide repeat unit polymerase family protein [Methanothermobacter wolfeii]MDI6841207.1 oligosaccharide repeat unit polymerase family protein [Methanothermobacter wolfeii]
MRSDIFSPYSVLLVLLIYLALALAGTGLGLRGLGQPSASTFGYMAMGGSAFALGVYLSSRIKTETFTSMGSQGGNPACGRGGDRLLSEEQKRTVIIAAVITGIILQAVNIYLLGGIPLLSGYLKARAVTKIWLLSYLLFLPSVNVLLSIDPRRRNYIPVIIGAFLFALTGYRTTVVVILLSAFITVYYSKKPSAGKLLVFITVLAAVALIVGYLAVRSIEWQQWDLNPVELILYRAGYTLMVFDRLIDLQGATRGSLLYYTITGYLNSTDPRAIVGEVVLGYRHSTTSLIFGPALLDFGLHAMLIQMFILGTVLGTVHRIQHVTGGALRGIYAVILAQTMVWVETGPMDLIVWLFYIMAILGVFMVWRCSSEAGSGC